MSQIIQDGPGGVSCWNSKARAIGPIALGGAADDAQGRGRLVEREAGEDAELDQLGGACIHGRQPGECIVEVDQVIRRCVVVNYALQVEASAAHRRRA